MATAILPTEIIFNKSPVPSPFSTKPVDARRPIRLRRKPKRSWRKRLTEARALATIGMSFVGAAIGAMAIVTLLPGGFA